MSEPTLAALLTAVLCAAAAHAEPFLVAETADGPLEVVPLDEFDPPAAGPAEPPEAAYWTFSSFEAAPLEDPAAAEAEVLARAERSRRSLADRGLIAADHDTLEQLTPREFVLVVAHVTRAAITTPLIPAGIDEQPLERYLAEGYGVCRHLSRVGEAVAELLRPHCPAARDVRVTAYGDHHTHSWLRAAARVPDEDGWRQVETHLDLTDHTPDELFAGVDLLTPRKLRRYPVAAMVLQRAGLQDGAVRELEAFLERPDTVNHAAVVLELLHAHLVADRWAPARAAAAEALAALDEEQRGWQRRATPSTPDQLIEMRVAVHQLLPALHDADPEGWSGAGLPPLDELEAETARLRALYDDLTAYAFDLEADLARLDLGGARARMERAAAEAPDEAWAYRGAYAAVLERGKSPVRARGDAALMLELAAERAAMLPDDDAAAADLANALLGRVDQLDRAGAEPSARDVELLQAHQEALPEALPESHLVRAWIAGRAGDAAAQGAEFEAVLRTCAALPDAERGPREEMFAILARVELERLAADAGRDDDAVRWAAEALAALQAASPALRDDPGRHEPLGVLWWNAGIRLTILGRDPALAVRIWDGFVAWDPDDPRGHYGRARGLVQRAIAELEAGDDGAPATAREATAALARAVPLEVPVPRSDEYLRLAWFNLATRFENAGQLDLALEVARDQHRALPDEPGGPILVARTLGAIAAGARAEDRCEAAKGLLDEGEALLAGLPPGPPAEEHLRSSAANAHRSLAIGAASCADLARAMAIVEAGLERHPEDPGLLELRDQLAERM